MDNRLVAWARAVKTRRGAALRAPVLWLFTDARRLADPLAAVARLPAGLCGVVFRHDRDPCRAELGRALARVCRRRRLMLVVAGDWRLAVALRAGLHLRGGRRPGHAPRWCRAVTSSAHGAAELRRARQAGAAVVFLSPVFATASHPDTPPLGPVRWGRLARGAGMQVAALGGIEGATVRRLPSRLCAGAGAIAALV
jgi:thiamine-phosphate pyrophosphorylase